MKLLINRISSAVEVDVSKAKKGIVSFGAWVRYNGRVVRIVGVDEADINKGLISFTSPLAKSLMGKKAGSIFEMKGARGAERVTIEEVSFAANSEDSSIKNPIPIPIGDILVQYPNIKVIGITGKKACSLFDK